MTPLIRVLFKATDNGQLFPVYFNSEAEIPGAAARLNVVEVERRPATEFELVIEQIGTIGSWGVR